MKTSVHDEIKAKLGKDVACYVLITCNEPNRDGEMNVELTYEGDPLLAEYLVKGAQNYFNQPEISEKQSFCC